jgi:hypothetical protein
VKCHNCRKSGVPSWPWRPDDACCRESTGEVAYADVAQWLHSRAIRVAWLVNARRNVPVLAADLALIPREPQ